MKTEQIYMLDPYQKVVNATILDFADEGNGTFSVILDKTVFYPMGGGQPTDQGFFIFPNGLKAEVFQVMIKDGEINHYIKFAEKIDDEFASSLKGSNVIGEINWERRFRNMKVHSAGHIIDFAIHILGYSPEKLSPFKGDHGKKAFVTYQGEVNIEAEELKLQIQNKVDELIQKNLSISWEFTSFDELKKEAIYLQPNLPTNKPLRILRLEGVGAVADGGTIVAKTGEVEGIEVESIEVKDGFTTIRYKISEKGLMNNDQNSEIKHPTSNVEHSHEGQTPEADSNLQQLITGVQTEITGIHSEDALTELWRKYLGKDGKVKDAFNKLSALTGEEKKYFGQQVNRIKNEIDSMINSAKEELKKGKDGEYLKNRQADLSFKKAKVGHLHPLTETINDLNTIFSRLGYSVYDGPELETYEFNFRRCNVPEDHPALDLQDSIYVEEPNILLRTQTSSMEARALVELKPPFKIVMPGRTYRNEKVNSSNHFVFHQYQLVCVQEKVSLSELISTIEYLFKTYLGAEVETRYRNKYYPEVEPGVGPDMRCFNCKGIGCAVCKRRGWIEMGGAGIIHPNIMRMAGLDTEKWQGFAFGLGLDRWAMAKHNITDIRTLLGGNLAYKSYVR